VAGLGYMANRALAATQQLEKLSKQTGFSTKAIQELQFAAREAGVRSDRLHDALGEMSQRMGEASADFQRTGGDVTEMGEGFQAAGLAVRNLDERNPQQVLYEVADAIREAETESKALNIAVKTFGDEGGRDMVAMLREGSGGLRDMAEEARELGLVLDEETIQKSVEAKQKVDLLVDVLGTQFQRVMGELSPQISQVADDMADWVGNNKDFLAQDVPSHIAGITSEVSSFAEAVSSIPEPVLYGGLGAVVGLRGGPYGALIGGAAGVGALAAKTGAEGEQYSGGILGGDSIGRRGLDERTMSQYQEWLVWQANHLPQIIETEKDYTKTKKEQSEALNENANSFSNEKEEVEKLAFSIKSLAAANRTLYGSATKQDIRRAQPVRDMGRGRGIGGAARGADDEWAKRMLTEDTSTFSRSGRYWASNFDDMENEAKDHFNYLEVFSRQTAENMQRNFSNFFFDAWTGELDSMSDYFESFGHSLLRTWADVQSQMLAKGLFGGDFMSGQGDMGGLIGSAAMSLFGPAASGGGMTGPPQAGIGTQNTLLSFDTGGTLPEDIYGFGKSGNAYNLHQGETVVPKNESQGQQPVNINLTIVAADAKSFSDMAKRNPQAIIGPIKEALNYGDMDLRASIKGA
jgi:hypothetical protein